MIAFLEELMARLMGRQQEHPIPVRVEEDDSKDPFGGRK
jgi:hypothetical protein